jgi:flagellar biogenesis protein FliO
VSRALGVTGLALIATFVTQTAFADPTEPAAAPATTQETALQLRTPPPLALETPRTSGGIGWRVALVGIVGAAGVWMWSRTKKRAKSRDLDLRVLRRTSVGVRSELLIVEVEGQRVLLGVTPNAIQNLMILPDAAASDEASLNDRREERDDAPSRATLRFGDRGSEHIEGQAQGLLALRARR